MLKPLGNRVIVKPGKEEAVTKGGIVLPDTAKKKPHEGKIIAVGDGKLLENGKRAEMNVKKGNTVIYSEYGGTEIKVDGEELVILDEDQILAVKE